MARTPTSGKSREENIESKAKLAAECAEKAAKEQGLPTKQIDAAKAVAIGTTSGLVSSISDQYMYGAY